MEDLNHTEASTSAELVEDPAENPDTAEIAPDTSEMSTQAASVEDAALRDSEAAKGTSNTDSEDAVQDVAEGVPEEGSGSWEDQLEESLAGTALKRGELREGVILDKKSTGFVVDIGAKRDGFVPIDDIEELEDKEFQIGDDVPVVVTDLRDSDGNVKLSIAQALLQEDWLKAEKLLESQDVYEAQITGFNRGGLTVDFGRLRGFVPMSQLIGFNRIRQPAERQRRLESMVGQDTVLKVIEVNRRRRRLILSQRAAAREWRAARRQRLLEELEAGQVRRGRISQIADFGLFVNLGGMDGLVHISELSWGRIENPAEIYHPGQRLKVKVLSVDRDRQRIALSIKALTPDPWESVMERYEAGNLVEGRVTQVVDFGVFIELEPGIEGLLHNSELRDITQREELASGDSILVKVIRIEPERRRIGLSVQQVRPDEWEEWALKQIEEEEKTIEASEDEPLDDDDLDFDDEDSEDQDDEGQASEAGVSDDENVVVEQTDESDETSVDEVETEA